MPNDENDVRGVQIGFSYNNISYEGSEYLPSTNGWERISQTYTAKEDIDAGDLSIYIQTYNVEGIALVKNVQLERGTVVNRYNFIENGHFYDALGTTSIGYWTRNASLTTSDKINRTIDNIGMLQSFLEVFKQMLYNFFEANIFMNEMTGGRRDV